MRRTLTGLTAITAAVACSILGAGTARGDILLAGFENTFNTAIPGMPFHKDLTPNPPDETGPDLLVTEFICGGGAASGVTQGDCAMQINHPTDWGTDEYYLILSDQGMGNAGELQFVDLIAQSTELRFDITTFGGPDTPDAGPTYRQIFVVLNTNYAGLGWYDANGDPDAQRTISNDEDSLFPIAGFTDEYVTTTVSLDLTAPLDQGGAEDNRVFWQALAQLIKQDNEDGTPIDPAVTFQMYLVFQGNDEPFANPVQIVMDNFRLIGPTPAGLDGDFNGDNFVNAADYTVWRDHLNQSDEDMWLNGNGDGSGTVDRGDYTLWKDNYGSSLGGSGGLAGSVPEPSTALMALGSLLAFVSVRRRR